MRALTVAIATLLLASASSAQTYTCEPVTIEATDGMCKGKISMTPKMCIRSGLSAGDVSDDMSAWLNAMDETMCAGSGIDGSACSALGGTEKSDFCKQGGMCSLFAVGVASTSCLSASDCTVTTPSKKPCCSLFKGLYNDVCTGADSAKVDEIVKVAKASGTCVDTDCIATSSAFSLRALAPYTPYAMLCTLLALLVLMACLEAHEPNERTSAAVAPSPGGEGGGGGLLTRCVNKTHVEEEEKDEEERS